MKLEDKLWDAWKHHAKYYTKNTSKRLMDLMELADKDQLENLILSSTAFVNGLTGGVR